MSVAPALAAGRSGDAEFFVCGAGPAGLLAAAALARDGARVILADPGPDPAQAGGRGDLRSTALLRPAQALLQDLGLWSRLAPLAAPLDALRIVDLAGEPPAIRSERSFSDPEGPLAWNFMNDALRAALVAHVAALPGVELLWGTGFARLLVRSDQALVTLSDGSTRRVRLAVAADGRDSPLREAAGIACTTLAYGQKALAFATLHAQPHRGVSIESYHLSDSFTTVPLPDRAEGPASAVVWMSPGPEAQRLAALDAEAFAAAATRRSAGLLGPLQPLGGRAVWPVVTRRARALTAPRVALLAEAAHVLPPIGAQGLNTSVNDILALARVAAAAPDPGGPAVLAAYARARAPDIAARAAAIDLFNRLTRTGGPLGQSLRRAGLALAHDLAPLRQALIRAGMGPG